MSKALERRHLPVPDSPSRKSTNEFGHLIVRLCANDENAGACADEDPSRADLAIFSQVLKGWDDELIE